MKSFVSFLALPGSQSFGDPFLLGISDEGNLRFEIFQEKP